MTKIWTLSTCGTGGRVCSASNLIGARRKPGGRRPGNPVSSCYEKSFLRTHSSSSSSTRVPLQFFSLRVVAPRAECKRASNISPILSSAFTSNRSATILLSNFVPTNCWTIHQYRRKLRFWKLAAFFWLQFVLFLLHFLRLPDRSCLRYENMYRASAPLPCFNF